ncbi:SurA N-terminal domain-containing protein [Pontiellaceae bacterium B12227]|nr:SurA N-terminal domain-containing protein [Pontiellaceae bacterium B12227]
MAMMISKFNKLIHNKTVWLVFAIFISIAFVGVYTGSKSSGSQQRSQATSEVAGKLWGEEISRMEFGQAYQSVYVMYSMMTGRPLNINDEVDEVLRRSAWQRLATLKKARQMGLTVTADQVVNLIKGERIFQNQQTGQYDANAYNAFIQGFLPRTGMSAKGFENMMSEQVLIQKASAAAAQGALVTEDEIKKAFHLYNDKLTVDYAALPRSLAGTIEVSDEDAKKYFTENAEQFRLPKKRIVHLVEFNVSDYTNTVEITDEIIAQIYEGNKQRYIIPETATNAVPEYRPLEEVKGEIFEIVSGDMSRRAAANAADAFVASLAGEGATFESEAEKAGLTIVANTPAFAATDRPRGVDPSAPFARAAFELELSPTQYYSDPVVGREKVYVIALKKELPDFLPEFDVVKADVMVEAELAAIEKAYVEKSDAIHAEIEAALKNGTSFADAASKYSLNIQTTAPFNISSPIEGDFAREIMAATVQFDKGTLVDLIDTNEEFLLAYIAEKEAADEAATLPGMRDDLSASIRQEKAARLAQAWQESLLEEADFQDLSAQPATDSEES